MAKFLFVLPVCCFFYLASSLGLAMEPKSQKSSFIPQISDELAIYMASFLGQNPGEMLGNLVRLSLVNHELRCFFDEDEIAKILFSRFAGAMDYRISSKVGGNVLHVLAKYRRYALLNSIISLWLKNNIELPVNDRDNFRSGVLLSLVENKPVSLSGRDEGHFDFIFSEMMKRYPNSFAYSYLSDLASSTLHLLLNKKQKDWVLEKLKPMKSHRNGLTYPHFLAIYNDAKGFCRGYENGELALWVRDMEKNKGREPVFGDTPVYVAARLGHWEILEEMLKVPLFQKQINRKAKTGHSPLHAAVIRGHCEVVKLLLFHGAKVNGNFGPKGLTPLMCAIRNERIEIVELLLKAGARKYEKDNELKTALLHAAEVGFVKGIRMLSREGARINVRDKKGLNALMTAQDEGYVSAVLELLSFGPKLDMRDHEERTVLMRAAQRGQTTIVKALVEKGASLDVVDKEGSTALISACLNGKTEAARVLLESGANPHVENQLKMSALTCAIKEGHSETISVLFEFGLGVWERNSDGETLLMWAAFLRSLEFMRWFLELNAPLDLKDKDGDTALMCGVRSESLDIVKMLLKAGANVHLVNNKGENALSMARRLPDRDIAFELLLRGAKPFEKPEPDPEEVKVAIEYDLAEPEESPRPASAPKKKKVRVPNMLMKGLKRVVVGKKKAVQN